MLGVSSPPNAICICNEHKSNYIKSLFDFSSTYLSDEGPKLLYVFEKGKKHGQHEDVRSLLLLFPIERLVGL